MDTTHLRRVLGSKAKDLKARDRQKEMLVYIARHRMYLTKNIPAVEDVDEGMFLENTLENIPENENIPGSSPGNTRANTAGTTLENIPRNTQKNTLKNTENIPGEFHIDFVAEIIYSADKVTPVNMGAEGDERVNEAKLFDAGESCDCRTAATAYIVRLPLIAVKFPA